MMGFGTSSSSIFLAAQMTRRYPPLIGAISARLFLGVSPAGATLQDDLRVADRVAISVDLGPWDRPQTREALELRRDALSFDGNNSGAWRLRVRAIDEAQQTLSVTFWASDSQRYIQEFPLDLARGDVERQVATLIVNWIDAVLADEYRPATAQELQTQRQKELAVEKQGSESKKSDSRKRPSESALESEREVGELRLESETRAKPERQRQSRGASANKGSWTLTSPTRWEIGLGLGLDHSLQRGPWLPGWSWLYVDAGWAPKRRTRLFVRGRWQSHRLDKDYLHRARIEIGPEWIASRERFGVVFGLSASVERWWAAQKMESTSKTDRLVSLGVQANAGASWRLLDTKSGIVFTDLRAQVRYSAELPGWVIPTIALQDDGPVLFSGGAELGLLWTLRWGRTILRPGL